MNTILNNSFTDAQNKKITDLYSLCIDKKIPLMRKATIKALFSLLERYDSCAVLEIGTAYGFSSLYMSYSNNVKNILTLEKDESRHIVAKQYLENNDKVVSILDDCFKYTTHNYYEVIVLDGPKSRQIELFEKYKDNLKTHGCFFIDNLFLKNISNLQVKTKNQLKLLEKLNMFRKYLDSLNKNSWNVSIFDIEDGYAIIERRI